MAEENKIMFKKLNKDNIVDAALTEYEIFPNSCAYLTYKKEINNQNDGWFVTYIAYLENSPIGIVGLYENPKYKRTAWLSWFGLKKEYRGLGYGQKMFDFIIEIAKENNMKELRLYTFEIDNASAQPFYRKNMDLQEDYYNELEDDSYNIWSGKPKTFSKSLTDEKIPAWDNKFIDITGDEEDNIKGIKLMRKDGVI